MSRRLIGYITLVLAAGFLAALFIYIAWILVFSTRDRIALADDVGNLKLDNPVKVSGVPVGKVVRLRRNRNLAEITLRVDRRLVVHSDYRLFSLDRSLMGDRDLVLIPGYRSDTLPVDSPLFAEFVPGIAEGIRNADALVHIVESIEKLVNEYSRTDPRNDSLFKTKLFKTLRYLDTTSRKLETLALSLEGPATRTVQKTAELARLAREQSDVLKPKLNRVIDKTADLSLSASSLLDSLVPKVEALNRLLTELEKPDNKIGALLTDKKLYDELIKTLTRTRKLLGILKEDGIKMDLDFF